MWALCWGKTGDAIARTKGNKETFIIKEGMPLGLDNAIVKAIMPGGVVLVEKIKMFMINLSTLRHYLPISNQ